MYVQAQQHRQCRAGDRHRVRDLRQHPQRGGAAGISQKVHCAVKVCTLMRGSAATSMRGVTASTKSWPWPMHRYDRRCGELVSRQTRRVVDVLRACREWWRRGYPVGACTWTDRVNGVSVTTNGRIAIRTQTARKVRARPGSNGHSGRENICDSAHSEVSLRTSSPRGALFAVTVCVATRARQPRRTLPPFQRRVAPGSRPRDHPAPVGPAPGPPSRPPHTAAGGLVVSNHSRLRHLNHCQIRAGQPVVPAVCPRRRDPPPAVVDPTKRLERVGRPAWPARSTSDASPFRSATTPLRPRWGAPPAAPGRAAPRRGVDRKRPTARYFPTPLPPPVPTDNP